MSDTVINVENLSKLYRLGEVGTGTISHDLNRWWARVRGKEDPFTKVGAKNDRTQAALKGEHVWALKDINFEVKQGEVLGIIGKNGAGKSTLLKILSRITSPTTGHIKAKGRIASLLEVGTGFHPEMTGRENVYLNGTILGMTKREIDKKFEEIMDFAGCLKYADTPVKRYSSGMMVRLGFAVAAFLEPEILIVDEVLAVGDAEFQKKAIGKMQDISSGGGRTVLFVSHNMGSVESLCNRCMVLKNGSIEGIKPTKDAIDLYLNQITRNLNMNLLDRRDRKGEGGIIFTKVEYLIENNITNSLASGKKSTIRLYYKTIDNQLFTNCRISVAVKKDTKPYIVFSSELIYDKNINLQGEGFIDYIIERFPLSKSYYYLTLYVESNNQVQDWIDAAVELEVEDGNFYKNGKNYPEGWEGKTVLVDHQIALN